MNRTRPIAHLLSLLAILAQLWLPLAHASAQAQHLRAPLAGVLCGVHAQNSSWQLRAQLPEELLRALDAPAANAHQLAQCSCCATFHAPALPSSANHYGLNLRARIVTARAQLFIAPASYRTYPPPARAPPVL